MSRLPGRELKGRSLRSLLTQGSAGQVLTRDNSALGYDWADALAGWSPILDHKPTTDTPDDDFDSTTLDGKWTVTSGSSGTVDLLESGVVEKYDLTTRPGWLLLQAGPDTTEKVALRQDHTLADGESVIAAVSLATSLDAAGADGSASRFVFGVNDTDSDFGTGDQFWFFTAWNATGSWEVNTWDGSSVIGQTAVSGFHLGQRLYLRMQRNGSNFEAFYSMDGSTWAHIGTSAVSGTNIWLAAYHASLGANDPVPIFAVDWIRQGTNALDPWPHSGLVALDTVPDWVTALDSDSDATSIDEFNDNSFTGWTTLTVAGAQTITEANDLCSINVTTSQGTFGSAMNAILVSNALSTGQAVEVAIPAAHQTDANGFIFGPVISNGTAAGSTFCQAAVQLQETSNDEVFFYAMDGTFNSYGQDGFGFGGRKLGHTQYVRLEYDASNSFKTWLSPDGVSWKNVHTATTTMTPSHIGFGWSSEDVSDLGSIVAIEYVRLVTV